MYLSAFIMSKVRKATKITLLHRDMLNIYIFNYTSCGL